MIGEGIFLSPKLNSCCGNLFSYLSLKWALTFVCELSVRMELHIGDNIRHAIMISVRIPFVIVDSICKNLPQKQKLLIYDGT